MDYSKLSDFEINKRVAIALGAKQIDSYENGSRCAIYYELDDVALTVRNGQGLVNEQFDPCNSAADAWPIIYENGISIIRDYDEWVAFAGMEQQMCGDFNWTHCYQWAIKNPLRGAMIVYLMMRESESE